ncbi:MAG: bifunctional pyr operon transcriptional regulator/uracil phosphoribosyltransferase PyrR [Verrucomicrobiota bacterium]
MRDALEQFDSEVLLSPKDIGHTCRRLAMQILEHQGGKAPCFVGIHTRGVTLAHRVAEILKPDLGVIEQGALDISLYRDDLDDLGSRPVLNQTDLPDSVDDRRIVLFDDVLYTGRTIKAAIDVLADHGRSASIELAVLIDRGNRELPIMANFVGMEVATSKDDYIRVLFEENDNEEGIFRLTKKG